MTVRDTGLSVHIVQKEKGIVESSQEFKTPGTIVTYLENDKNGEIEAVTLLGGNMSGEEMLKMIVSFKTTLMVAMGKQDAHDFFKMADEFIEKMEDKGYL